MNNVFYEANREEREIDVMRDFIYDYYDKEFGLIQEKLQGNGS